MTNQAIKILRTEQACRNDLGDPRMMRPEQAAFFGDRRDGKRHQRTDHKAGRERQQGSVVALADQHADADGEQRRDFVFVRDLARINMFFAGLLPNQGFRQPVQAVVNAGTGHARTFKDVARALMQVHGPGKIEYIPFPGDLKNRYQHFTEADVAGLRAAGYTDPFTPLEEGVKQTFAETK